MFKWTVYMPFLFMIFFLAAFIFGFGSVLEAFSSKDWIGLSLLVIGTELPLLFLVFIMLNYLIMSSVLSFEVTNQELTISFIKRKLKPPFFQRHYFKVAFPRILQIDIIISKGLSINLLFYSDKADSASTNAKQDYQVIQWHKSLSPEVLIRQIWISTIGLTKAEYIKVKNIVNFVMAENSNIKLNVHEGPKTKTGRW